LGNKINNGIIKIESVCLKYETVSKRHIIWTLFEEKSGQYESYEDFKCNWDSNVGLWDEIKRRTKNDLKAEIGDLLGIKGNKPAIGHSLNREIDDLIRNKRPFYKSGNNVTNNVHNNSSIINTQEESSNIANKGKNYTNRSHKSRKHSLYKVRSHNSSNIHVKNNR
jgi:hypothetical protein